MVDASSHEAGMICVAVLIFGIVVAFASGTPLTSVYVASRVSVGAGSD